MPKKLTIEHVKEFINKEQLLISTVYINNKTLLEIQCNICKEHYNQNFDRYKRGHRHQKCSNSIYNTETSLNALRIKYNNKILLKDTIRICEWCTKKYNPKRFKQKLCNKECATIFHKNDETKKINSKNMVLRVV